MAFAFAAWAPTANAYFAYAQCNNYTSAQTCWVGDGYHGLIRVTEIVFQQRFNICAKAQTAAGNLRTGSGCNVNTDYRSSLLSSTDPISAGYGYWAGTGAAEYDLVKQCSPTDESLCIGA